MTVTEIVQLGVFGTVAVAAARLWWQQRTRPSFVLAATFLSLSFALILATVVTGGAPLATAAIIASLLAVPWLLALFAWSFGPRYPRWLLVSFAGGMAVFLGWWLVARTGPEGSGEVRLFALVVAATWVALSVAAAVRLWRAGGEQQLIRARMRTLALGALTLAGAIVIVATGGEPAQAVLGLVVISAGLFFTGIAPPRPVRTWWRRRITDEHPAIYLDLLAATDPVDIARAVVVPLADLVGGTVAVYTGDGQLLASSSDQDPRQAGGDLDTIAGPNYELAVATTPYSPTFGQDERSIIEGFTTHLQLALERADLLAAKDRMHAELDRAGQELEAMTVGLAHDLRNPTAVILGYTEMLYDAQDEIERVQMLDGVGSAGRYLNQLVDALMDLSRIGRSELERTTVDLGRTIDRIRERMATSHPNVRIITPGAFPPVLANPLALEQTFDNLLVNAAKHGAREELTITVTAHVDGDRTTIDVADDGQGIHPDDRDAIFTPFRRGRTTSGGSGVGLGLVRRIVQAHRGSIELVDSAVGAHFRICLPLTES